MRRTLAVAAVMLAVTIAAVAYAFFKPPEEASGPIEAVPVTVETNGICGGLSLTCFTCAVNASKIGSIIFE